MAVATVKIKDGEALREALSRRGMTYRELAEEVGVTYQRIGQLVTEVYPHIQAVYAATIEDTLGVPRGALFAPLDNAGVFQEPHGPDGAVPDARTTRGAAE